MTIEIVSVLFPLLFDDVPMCFYDFYCWHLCCCLHMFRSTIYSHVLFVFDTTVVCVQLSAMLNMFPMFLFQHSLILIISGSHTNAGTTQHVSCLNCFHSKWFSGPWRRCHRVLYSAGLRCFIFDVVQLGEGIQALLHSKLFLAWQPQGFLFDYWTRFAKAAAHKVFGSDTSGSISLWVRASSQMQFIQISQLKNRVVARYPRGCSCLHDISYIL